MNLRHLDPVIDKDNPFLNCKLDRKKYSDVLTQIVKTYGDGFVMAINNKWGTGKTTFIKMWEATLVQESYQTVYFNAWENDFEDNPLTAIMGELRTLINQDNKDDFKVLLDKGAVLAKSILPMLIKSFVAKHLDMKELSEYAEKATEGLTNIFEQDVKLYTQKKESIKKFREELEQFILKSNHGKPLVFIIDELDRCRPNYSVSILEQIKHFFSVKGIVFVLSIDKEQLGNAVRGVYGNDRIDAEEYLRRFIDIEYIIPKPTQIQFVKYLYNYYEFSAFFRSSDRMNSYETQNDEEIFINTSAFLFEQYNISLRQQEKIFAHARISLRTFSNRSYVFPHLFVILLYFKSIQNDLYQKIADNSLSIEELQIELVSLFKINNMDNDNLRQLTIIESYLVFFYNNSLKTYYNPMKIYEPTGGGDKKWFITSKVDKGQQDFRQFIESFERGHNSRIDLKYLIQKIELLDNVVI